MTSTCQLSSLDAVTLSQLTSHFDALPGGVLVGDPQPGAAGAEPVRQPAAEVLAGSAPAGGARVLAASGTLVESDSARTLAANPLVGLSAAERLDPAAGTQARLSVRLGAHAEAAPKSEPAKDFTALRSWQERYGHFEPAPPWTDPRPDLRDDHARWTVLLALAWARDGPDPYGVYGALYGVRCCGAAMVTDAQPLDLTPAGPPLRWRLTRGEIPESEWQAYRTRWLWPHQDVLVRLLQGGQGA